MPRIGSPLSLALLAALASPGGTGMATALPVFQGGLVPPDGALILIQEAVEGGASGSGGYGGGTEGGGVPDDSASDENESAGVFAPVTSPIVSPVQSANAAATRAIVRQVEEATRACGATDRVYRVSCLAIQFGDLARRIPPRGDYAAAAQALAQVSTELDRIARANRDRTKPRISLRVAQVGGTPKRSAPFSAIRPEAVTEANAQATASVERLQATLLRSVPDADPRDVHYQRIASSFNSAAVLLRS